MMDDMTYTTDSYLIRDGIGRTPWAVYCNEHSSVYLTRAEYRTQLMVPGRKWICPICHEIAEWDDENYEDFMEKLEAYNLSPADEKLVEYNNEKDSDIRCWCRIELIGKDGRNLVKDCFCEECLTSEVVADARLCCQCHD